MNDFTMDLFRKSSSLVTDERFKTEFIPEEFASGHG